MFIYIYDLCFIYITYALYIYIFIKLLKNYEFASKEKYQR